MGVKESSEMINRSVRFSKADLAEATLLGLNVNKVCRNALRRAVRGAMKSKVSLDELHRAAYEAVMEEKIKTMTGGDSGHSRVSEEMPEDRENSAPAEE